MLKDLLQEQKKYARDAFAKLPIYPETETTKAIQIANTFLDTLLTTAITKGYGLALLELEGEARRDVVRWENSEDWDGTTNDGLYGFIQTIAQKRKDIKAHLKETI